MPGAFTLGEVREEITMIFFNVSVLMTTRSSHETYVAIQVVIRVISAILPQRIQQQTSQLQIQCILTGLELLVMVHAWVPPKTGLIMQDFSPLIQRCITRAPENALSACGLRGST